MNRYCCISGDFFGVLSKIVKPFWERETQDNDRRKFRSESSDNMDSWKSRGGKSQRGEEKKWEDQRRKKMQVREKVGKSRFTVFFQWFVAQEGRRVGSLKRRVRSQLARWEKLPAVVARSTFPSQKPTVSDHFWKLRCRTSALRCGAKHISKSKSTKHTRFGPLLEVEMSKSCAPLWRQAHVQVKSVKKLAVLSLFWLSDVENAN